MNSSGICNFLLTGIAEERVTKGRGGCSGDGGRTQVGGEAADGAYAGRFCGGRAPCGHRGLRVSGPMRPRFCYLAIGEINEPNEVLVLMK